MQDYLMAFFMGTLFGAIVFLVLTFEIIIPRAQEVVMKDAYERGHAVQCIGKTGYYWECEENKTK